jgi:hypothetical protein
VSLQIVATSIVAPPNITTRIPLQPCKYLENKITNDTFIQNNNVDSSKLQKTIEMIKANGIDITQIA